MSRDAILKRVRQNLPQSTPLPDLDRDWIQYEDPTAHFLDTLTTVGGQGFVVANRDQVNEELGKLSAYADAAKKCSLIPELGESNVDVDAIDDPHDLEDVDFAVIPGAFAVAENGAVWVPTDNMKHRVLPFITQHLAMVVEPGDVVHNMHEAYKRISFEGRSFGVFISGPSKTADIEQSLVIGAHGPRSHVVFLVEG